MLFKQSLEQVNSRVLEENKLDCIMSNEFAMGEFGHWIDGIPYQMKADVECDHSRFNEIVNSMLTDYHNGKEDEVYFYHSDHLGSASWKKERFGKPFASERADEVRSGIPHITTTSVQHLQYLPFGEPYVNQHPAGYQERFTFTGKERDEETGYGYFGARYMDYSLMTMWLSVDPLSDKYPNISPYAYCAWNPVKLVDPDGRDVLPTSEEAYQMILSSLPEEARPYVQRNADGSIDRELMNSFDCESQNYNDLRELVNLDNCTIEVSVAYSNPSYINCNGEYAPEDFQWYGNPSLDAELLEQNGGVTVSFDAFEAKTPAAYSTSTGEYGNLGVTYLPVPFDVLVPDLKRSINNNIQVYINGKLSTKGRAENFAHEFFGHAYIYAKTKDAIRAGHLTQKRNGVEYDTNLELKNRITRAQNEAASYN